MKKTAKLLACISAVTIMTSGMSITSHAEETCWGYTNGDIYNIEYLEYLSNCKVSSVEDWLMEIDFTQTSYEPLHVYVRPTGSLLFEYGKDSVREIHIGFLSGISITEENALVTKEELNAFLESKCINAKVDYIHLITDDNGNITAGGISSISRADGESESDDDNSYKMEAYSALCKEYGYIPNLYFQTSTIRFEETTLPVQTIAGDLDLNNEQGISDIVALTKYNASPELYPITDATALANADINQDGTIDAIDTSLLIEIMLGTFESAV